MSVDPDEPLDDIDAAILAQLHDANALLDPPPETLIEQVRFALDLADLDAEVARLQDDALIGSGARGSARTRTLTFEASGLSLLLSITELGADGVRLDGWLSPADAGQVELRYAPAGRAAGAPAGGTSTRPVIRQATPDEAGRLLFENLSHGLIQIRIHRGAGTGGGVLTPSIVL